MLLAAAGGVILFISIMLFVVVAIGTAVRDEKTESMQAEFAQPSETMERTPEVLQHFFRWGAVALLLAVVAYAGPMYEMLHSPGFLAPGMRTW